MAIRPGRWESNCSQRRGFFLRMADHRARTTGRLLQLSVLTLIASTIVCSAGPCSLEISKTQALLNAWLEATAGAAPLAAESSSALRHRQPTPSSIASAEAELGEISADKAKIIGEAMARARAADQSGDRATCDEALAEVKRTIGP